MIHVFSPTTPHELVISVARLLPGAIHRATRQLSRPGGKPVNVARFCGRMGVAVRLVAVADGRAIEALRADSDLAGATLELLPSGVEARTDVVVTEEDGRASVLNGTAPGPAPALIAAAFARLIDGTAADDLVVLAGSLPVGVDAALYARAVARLRERGARTLVDASGAWLRATLPAAPDLIKVTVEELATACEATTAAAWTRGPELAAEPAALVVTAGERGARAWQGGVAWTAVARPQRPVNPTGAGDALTAGLATGLAAGRPLAEALADGVAWAAAKVRELDFTIDPEVVRALRPDVSVVRRAARSAASTRTRMPASW